MKSILESENYLKVSAVIPAYNKPIILLLIITGSIYVIELFNMYLLYLLPDLPRIPEAILDSTLLIVLISPVLYLFLFRPVMTHISKNKKELDIRTALFNISEAVFSTDDIKDLLSSIHHILGGLIDAKNFYIALYDDKANRYTFPYFVDEYGKPDLAPQKLKQSLTDYVRRTGEPLLLDKEGYKKLERDGKIILLGTLPLIWLGVPLIASTGVIGVVTVQNYHDKNAYSNEDLELMHFVAQNIASAIEKKQAEEDLRKLSLVIEKSQASIIITDAEGKIEYVNPQFTKLTGYTSEEAIGKTPNILQSKIHNEEFYEELWNTVTSGKTWIGEFHNKKKNGELYWESAIISPVFDSEGKITRYVAIKENITERKRLEEEEHRLQIKLKEAKRLESLGILAGGVAHDLNNILGPIRGYPDLILEILPEDSAVRDDIIAIKTAADRASDVIGDLLALARRGRYNMKPLNLNDVVKSYLNTPNFSALKETNKSSHLKFDIEDASCFIKGSNTHLEKVIMNLTINAFESMEDGGTVSINTSIKDLKRASLLEDISVDGKFVVLEISDEGYGISEENINSIFDPFFTTKKKTDSSGTGLGLAVVHGVIKDHDGFIEVESQVGHGSKFTINFPFIEEKPLQEQMASYSISYQNSENLLIVEDSEEQRRLGQRLLEHLGYDIVCVENGRACIEYLRNHGVDLVLLDMIMEEDFDGLDTYKEIRKIQPELPVIIVSGFSESERIKEAINLGVKQLVKKPYRLNTIGRAIREVLGDEILEVELL
ncbi:MAG: PAS domain S-box protein [Candidatus Marinimicrobia bacterium]|nr:PAS domain S-box protein [Candidatus Neomarinimicrobiota bacterium]